MFTKIKKRILLFIYGLFFISISTRALAPSFGFIENKGQILDQFRQPNNNVLFLLNGKYFNVHLTRNGFSYEQTSIEQDKDFDFNKSKVFNEKTNLPRKVKYHRVAIEFVNANPNPEVISLNQNTSKINYYNEYSGKFNFENINHYNKVVYQNIYPGIDIEFLNGDQFKYNIILHPGASLSDVKLRINGSLQSQLNRNNELEMMTSLDLIKETIPLSYLINSDQTKQKTTINFSDLGANTYGFIGETYSKKQTLVIDPSPWATYFGGTADESGSSIATDSIGNIFVAGYTYSNYGVATSGSFQSSYNGNNDGFILKFNENGNLIWATYYGGNNNDYCYDLSVSKSGTVLVAGLTGSASGIASSGSFQSSLNGTIDAFLCKFNSNGTQAWATYFGGNNLDYGYGVTSDLNENVILSGYTNSTTNLSTSLAFQTSFSGTNDAMIAKFTPNGALSWATYYGGGNSDFGSDIQCDESGNIFFTGFTSSTTGIATSNAYQSALSGTNNNDAFIVKLTPSGSRQWATYFGGEGNEDGRSIALDKSGNIFLAGTSYSSSGIATIGTFQTLYKGENESFIAAFDSTGNRKWGTYIGGDADDYLNNIKLDKQGNLVVVGFTYSPNGLTSSNAYQTNLKGSIDAYIGKFDTTGNRIWATYYGGLIEDYANSLAINHSNYILVTGITNSTTFVSTLSSFQTTLAGSNDAFILSLTPNGNVNPIINNTIVENVQVCPGETNSIITGSTPSGAVGLYTFTWLKSTTGPNSGYSPAPGVNNLASYIPPASLSNYWLKRMVVSGGEIDTSNFAVVTIKPRPNAIFQTNELVQCVNQNSFQLDDLSTPNDSITSRKWYFGDGFIDSNNVSQINKTYTISGSFIVKLIRANLWGCKDSFSRTLLVNPAPIAAIFTNQFTTFCQGENLILQSNLVNNNIIFWFKNNELLADTTKLIHINTSGLYYSVQTNNFGCSDTSNSISIIVNPKPKAEIEGAINKYICGNDSLSLQSVEKNLPFYRWTINGKTILGSNQNQIKINQHGLYQLILRNQFGCYDTSTIHVVTAALKPILKPISGKTKVFFTPFSLKIDTYYVNNVINTSKTWLVNNKFEMKGDTLFHQWNMLGSFSIKMFETTQEGCKGDTNSIVVLVTDINGLASNRPTHFSISPNPSEGYVQLQFDCLLPEKIIITDLNGRIIDGIEINFLNNTLDLSHLPKGFYLLNPISENLKYATIKLLLN